MLRWGSDFTPNNWEAWQDHLQGVDNDLPTFRYDYGYAWDEPDPEWRWLQLATTYAYDVVFPPFIGHEFLEQHQPLWMPSAPD